MLLHLLNKVIDFVSQRPERAYFFYCLLLTLLAFFSIGWLHVDEHARVLEPAHRLIFGYATLPWELTTPQPIVSYLLAYLHAPWLYLLKPLHLSGMHQAALMRVFAALINATQLIALANIINHLCTSSKRTKWIFLLLYAFAPFTPVTLIRTSQENWATTALLWSIACFLRICNPIQSTVNQKKASDAKIYGYAFLCGICATFSVTLRMQLGPSVALYGLLIVADIIFHHERKAQLISILALGAMIGLLPMALADLTTYKTPFVSAWNYLQYALSDEEGGDLWGKKGWIYYLKGYFTTWYPLLGIILTPILLIGMTQSWILTALLLPFISVHLILSHKELRYFTPMLPIFHLSVIMGYERLSRLYPEVTMKCKKVLLLNKTNLLQKVFLGYFGFTLICSVLFASVPLNPTPFLYNKLNELKDQGQLNEFTYVGNTRVNVSLFYYKHPEALPNQMTLDPFLLGLKNKTLMPGTYAFYRVPYDTFKAQIAPKCQVTFVTLSDLEQWAYTHLAKLIKVRLIDGIVECP